MRLLIVIMLSLYGSLLLSQSDTISSLSYPNVSAFIVNNIEYPQEAKDSLIEGKVLLNLDVNDAGNVVNISIEKGIHPIFDNEVKRVISLVPINIQPAESPVMRFRVPINFRLDQ